MTTTGSMCYQCHRSLAPGDEICSYCGAPKDFFQLLLQRTPPPTYPQSMSIYDPNRLVPCYKNGACRWEANHRNIAVPEHFLCTCTSFCDESGAYVASSMWDGASTSVSCLLGSGACRWEAVEKGALFPEQKLCQCDSFCLFGGAPVPGNEGSSHAPTE